MREHGGRALYFYKHYAGRDEASPADTREDPVKAQGSWARGANIARALARSVPNVDQVERGLWTITGTVVPPWYRLLRPMRPTSRHAGTLGTAGTRHGRICVSAARFKSGRPDCQKTFSRCQSDARTYRVRPPPA
jgi:hypothetical protein